MVCDVDIGTADATRIHTVEVARWLAAEGFAVELVVRGPDPALTGVRLRSAGPRDVMLLRRILGVNGRAIATLVRQRRRGRACYVRQYWTLVPTILAARALGYRVVAQVDNIHHGQGPKRKTGVRDALAERFRNLALRIMGRCAAGIVAVKDGIAATLVRDFGIDPAKVRVIPNGVDVEVIRPVVRSEAIEESKLDPSCRYVIFIGNIAGWVDFDTMLRAFAAAAETRPQARLLLVGDGPKRPSVEALIAELGIGDRVLLTGYVMDRDRMRNLLGAATVCTIAYRPDEIGELGVAPVKLAEYLAAGRAVVTTDVIGAREMVEGNGAGVAVPPGVGAMAEALGRLLDDPEAADEMGRAGRRAAEKRYTWRSVVERTLPLLLKRAS
ncbi:MAG: glycosyltransferase family 4 protein [Actinomycetota bacterium]